MKLALNLGLIAILVAACATGPNSDEQSSPTPPAPAPDVVAPADARAIAKEAYIYGFPIVDNYRIQYSYFVDKQDPDYKGDWNQVHSTARLFTPQDTAVQTPNSDTPYSMLGADLRTEPLVLTVPSIAQDRYYSLQFIDGYTSNIAYVGTRTTGNGGGKFLLAGPNWQGDTPEGVDQVIRSDSELTGVIYRTQLFGPSDLAEVEKIQAGYTVEPLSAYLGQPAPAPAPAIDFVPPLSAEQQKTSPQFFEILNFAMRFAPGRDGEQPLLDRFATLGIGPDGDFDADKLSPELRADIEGGMADAWAELQTFQKEQIATGKVSSADLFGSPEEIGDNYLYRMAGDVLGIYGNSKDEATYPISDVDDTGAPLTGANRYTYRFAPGQLPPVNAFWSLTMYEMPQSLLVENPIQRYLINSEMLPSLVADPDGGYTLFVQHDSPGAEQESNWLPAPEGPFRLALRLYLPKPDALNGTWTAPVPVKVS
ncbi:MAG: DUF1254 domain-containing protein [Mycobacterium sp.]